ncbi:biopolymer transporter ExbD [Sphingosinicella sp. BN140058]|nr:biopolymer transporter ExbD [Sphingosinicella sp. BN140058]
MHRRPVYATIKDAPISDLNTTPLIDVMLVLLIMFIITIPITTHSVKLNLPTVPETLAAPPETHRLDMDGRGGLTFDGKPISEAALTPRLVAMRTGNPEAVLHFRTDGKARYEDFDRTLAVVKRAGIERLGFLGNEGFVDALQR